MIHRCEICKRPVKICGKLLKFRTSIHSRVYQGCKDCRGALKPKGLKMLNQGDISKIALMLSRSGNQFENAPLLQKNGCVGELVVLSLKKNCESTRKQKEVKDG